MSTDLHPVRQSETSLSECPYRGLQPYGEEDAEFYFGRDSERDLVIANLMASPLTVLYGPSGVGKSSLLRAGVMSMLRRMPDSSFSYLAVGHAIVVYHATWREDPLAGLGKALGDAIPEELKPPGFAPPSGPLSLELLRELASTLDADIYLLLDQFEEEALYVAPEEAEALAVELGRIVSAQGLRASILIGVREDALAKLDSLEAHVPGLFSNNLRLEHLGAESARRAIEQPLVRYNAGRTLDQQVSVEPALVDELLTQLRTGHLSVAESGTGGRDKDEVTIETPFLQLVMRRLWREEQRRGSRTLCLETLHALGDAERIVRTHLDHVMAQLTDDQRETAAAVFRYLVTPSGMKIAHTAQDLAEYAGLDASALITLTEELASGSERILRPVEPPIDRPGAPRYEIFHDVLAPAVLDWRRRYIEEKERTAAQRTLVAERQEAERLHQETRRRLRRSRTVSALLVGLLVIAIGAVAYAQHEGTLARASATAAEVATTLSAASDRLNNDPAAALGLAVKARNMATTPATDSALRVALDADRERLRVSADVGTVNTASFSPDGATFVTGGSDGVAKLFDARTGRRIRTFGASASPSAATVTPNAPPTSTVPRAPVPAASSRGEVTAVAFSADGAFVAVTSGAPETAVYDVNTGGRVLTVKGYQYYTAAIWGTRDGQQVLYTGGWGKPAQAWRASDGTLLATYGEHGRDSAGLSLSTDGTRLVTSGADSATVWDVRSGKALKQTRAGIGEVGSLTFAGPDSRSVAMWLHPTNDVWWFGMWAWQSTTAPKLTELAARAPRAVEVSGDRARVATVYDKGTAIFDADTSQLVSQLPDQPDLLTSVALAPSGDYIATAGVGGQALTWRADVLEQAPVDRLLGHGGAISSIHYSPNDPRLVLTTGWDGTARLWEIAPRTVLSEVSTWMQAADISEDGSEIISVSDGGRLRVVDRTSGRVVVDEWLDSDDGKIDFARVAWLPDGKRAIVTTAGDTFPRLWERDSAYYPDKFEGHEEWTYGLAVDASGSTVAMGDQRNEVILWNVDTEEITAKLKGGDSSHKVLEVAFIPHTPLVAGASTDGTVRLWDVAEPTKAPRTLGSAGTAPLTAVTPSADGTWIAVATASNQLRIYRVRDGALVRTINGPTSYLGDLAFNPDASLLAVAAGDGAVHVWDRATGELRAVLHRHGGAVNTVEFTKDGKQLVTASDDGTTAIFTCTTCGPIDPVLDAASKRLDARAHGSMATLDKGSGVLALGPSKSSSG